MLPNNATAPGVVPWASMMNHAPLAQTPQSVPPQGNATLLAQLNMPTSGASASNSANGLPASSTVPLPGSVPGVAGPHNVNGGPPGLSTNGPPLPPNIMASNALTPQGSTATLNAASASQNPTQHPRSMGVQGSGMTLNNTNNNTNTMPLGPAAPAPPASNGTTHALDDPNVYHWICQLAYGPQKEQALLELGRKREQFDDLAVVLWSSFGVMTALLNEIISVYPLLQPQMLSNQLSNRVCNALVLLQCVASHPETKHLFLQAHIPLFLLPFLNTTSRQRTFEYLRLTSLGVVGALVKNESQDVIGFLLRTEIVPLCLRIMESSSELSKTVAIFILQKILLDDVGLQYICATMERFYAVTNVLKDMVDKLTAHTPPGRLLKHIIRCYLRLSDDLEARKLLTVVLPAKLRDNTFTDALRDDVGTKRCLAQLLLTLNEDTNV